MFSKVRSAWHGVWLVAVSVNYPAYNHTFQIADHNAYWNKRILTNELFASGIQTRLTDQLGIFHARSLEIDIHKHIGHTGEWEVFHTTRTKNSLCPNFRDCLRTLKLFHDANPNHEVVTIVLELKEIIEFNFDRNHTPEMLDQLIEQEMGDLLFRPGDLMKQCPDAQTLRKCMGRSDSHWPSIDQLRGKFIFTVLGNWRYWFIGHGTHDWAAYATIFSGTEKSIRDRAIFPMETDYLTYTPKFPAGPIPNLETARENSIFMQVENLSDPTHLAEVKKRIDQNQLVVRGGDSYDVASQQTRIASGFQLLQTDYPWIQYDDKGVDFPIRNADTLGPIQEPGHRLFLHAGQSQTLWSPQQESTTPFDTWGLISSARETTNLNYPSTFVANGVVGNQVYYINEQATSVSLAYQQSLTLPSQPQKIDWAVPLAFKDASLPSLEEVTFSSGNRQVPGYLFTPQAVCSKIKVPLPAVIYLHGGNFASFPNSEKVFTDQNDETILYTQLGDIVFKPGFFGDVFYGDEYLYKSPRFIDRERFEPQLQDVAAAIAYVKSLPCVDQNRIVLFGHSYGAMIGSAFVTSQENLNQRFLRAVFLQSGGYSESFYKSFGVFETDEIASPSGDAARKFKEYTTLQENKVPLIEQSPLPRDLAAALTINQKMNIDGAFYGTHYQLSDSFYKQISGIDRAPHVNQELPIYIYHGLQDNVQEAYDFVAAITKFSKNVSAWYPDQLHTFSGGDQITMARNVDAVLRK